MLKRIILICQIIFILCGDLYFITKNLEGENIQLKESFNKTCKIHVKYKYKGYCEKYKIWVLIPDNPEYKLNDTIVSYKPLYPLGSNASGSSICFFVLSLGLVIIYIKMLYDNE